MVSRCTRACQKVEARCGADVGELLGELLLLPPPKRDALAYMDNAPARWTFASPTTNAS